MTVLITGGFGYLGGRLARFLAAEGGYNILLATRCRSEPPFWLPQAKVVNSQWDSLAGLERICAGANAVVHLAGMNAADCAASPVAALEFNGVATARLIEAAVRQDVKRFIYLSTAHVYRIPLSGIITEETCPVSFHPYATSHRAGEDVVRAAHERGEIEGIVIRLSNAYGAPVHKNVNCWTLLINDLCRQAVTTKRMVLRSSGLQRRDVVPLSDVCRAVCHLLHLPVRDNSKVMFNVGGDWSPTVWEVGCLVQERCAVVLDVRPNLIRIPPQIGEPSADLDYRIDVLLESGFRPNSDRVGEIDGLLDFCRISFS